MTENEVMDYEVDFDYPKKIHLHWNGVPDNLDAAFVYTNNEVYFFKGFFYYSVFLILIFTPGINITIDFDGS